jgi:tetratricopeptide (TPR) repeat protein
MQNTRIGSFFNSVSVWSAILVPVVALLGFAPFAPLWVEGSKVLVSGILITVAAVAYVVAGLFEKRFSLPHVHVLLGTGLYALTILCATLFVKAGQASLFGIGIEAWTITHIFAGLLFFILVSVHAQNNHTRRKFVYVLIYGALIAVLFQLVRIASVGAVGNFSIFTDPVINTLGRWFDLGIVALLLTLVAVVAFAVKAQTRMVQIFTALLFVISFVFFVIVSPLVGLLLLALGAILVRYVLSMHAESSARKSLAMGTLLVIVVFSFVAFVFQGLTGRSPLFFQSESVPTFSQTRADIAYRDFPSTFISDSFAVVKGTVQESPVFGVGAARFQEAWAEYRPLVLNETAWWATDFDIGSGIVVTVCVMFGVLGLFGLLAFLFVVFRGILHSLRSSHLEEKVSALLAAIVWVFALVQTPSVGLMIVMFTLTGIVFSYRQGVVVVLTQKSHTILALLIATLILVLPVYGVWSRVFALTYVLQSERMVAETPAQFTKAEVLLRKAVSVVPHEVYYQALATVQQRSLSEISTKIASKEISEQERTQLSNEFNQKVNDTITTYTQAIAVNKDNYVSYLRRAQFLANFLGQENDATIFATARADVKDARALAPSNATIDILEAQLYLQKNNPEEAQKLLLAAIEKKANYTDAAIILSQLKIKQGNLKEALTAAEYAVRTNVNNSQALYIYGQLQFEAKNYLAASQAFEQALSVQGSIPAEIGGLLAESYVQIGELSKAQTTYEELLKLDPNNAQIKAILAKLKQPPTVNTSTTPKK